MTNDAATMGQNLISKLGRPARLVAVGMLALVLLVPLNMVRSVVRERHITYRGVVSEISGSWSGDQRVAGPILVIPFSESVEVRDEFITPEGEKKVSRRWETCRRQAVILPDVLNYEGRLAPETRNRGIYQVQVYTANLLVSGRFENLETVVASLVPDDRLEEIDWAKAVVGFGVSDPRGLVEVDGFEFNGHRVQPKPGTTLEEILPSGFHLAVGESISDTLEFTMPMVIRGSGGFQFLPLGETTNAAIGSDWPHPSFVGKVLPAQREISEAGFTAEWTIPLLNRSYPQVWRAGSSVDIDEIEAGVRLFEPVALYDLVTRAVKYGLLFIALTFLSLGLIEHVMGLRLSLVQFLLIGVALAMFFLILIALAEHMGFTIAYVLASSTVVIINTLYCAAILGRTSTSAIVGAVLASIYGILYLILQAEDFALLGGTLLLVVALVVTMFFTRRIHDPEGV